MIMDTITVRCAIPTCDHAVDVDPPIDYVPNALLPEATDALQRKAVRMANEHADTHTGEEWLAACSYYIAHLDREVARSHVKRLRTGPAVWTHPDGSQIDVMVHLVRDASVKVIAGQSVIELTDPDALAQVTMLQVRPG